MGCRRTGSFLDLPLILGCGDQLCQILAASTRQLPPQKFNLIQRIRHRLLYQILFQEKMSLKTKINRIPIKADFLQLSPFCFFAFGEKFARSSFSSFFGIISSDYVLFTGSSSGLTSFQYAKNVTTVFLVAFLVFSESLPSIKVCISSSQNL